MPDKQGEAEQEEEKNEADKQLPARWRVIERVSQAPLYNAGGYRKVRLVQLRCGWLVMRADQGKRCSDDLIFWNKKYNEKRRRRARTIRFAGIGKCLRPCSEEERWMEGDEQQGKQGKMNATRR